MGEYKAQGPTLRPTEGRALRGPRALDSPVTIRKPVSKKFIAWLKFQIFSPFLKTVTEPKNHD